MGPEPFLLDKEIFAPDLDPDFDPASDPTLIIYNRLRKTIFNRIRQKYKFA
jgi:hypothetical protein